MKAPKKVTRNYVNNKDLLAAMIGYRSALQENPNAKVPEYVGECILLIATNLADKYNFANYSYKDEMISDGIENCLMYGVKSFDSEKTSNPFAYFTQIIYLAFIRRIQKEKKQQYIKYKNLSFLMTHESLVESKAIDPEMYENNLEFIKNYEEKIAEKKLKNKAQTGIEEFLEKEDSNSEPRELQSSANTDPAVD